MNTEVTSTSAEVIKDLKAAKRRIQTKGWVQGGDGLDLSTGACCAGVALSSAHIPLSSLAQRYMAYDALGRVIGDTSMFPEDAIVSWNDAPERTKADVLKAFASAITLAGI